MNYPTLHDLIPKGILPDDDEFIKLLELGSAQPESYLAVCNLLGRSIEYISPSCKALSGYEPDKFISGGSEFVYSITLPTSIPGIIKAQTGYIMEAKAVGFDPSSIVIHEYPADFRLALGYTKRLISLAVVLRYTSNADMEYGIAMIVEDKPELIRRTRSLLIEIKKRHNQIYQHVPLATISEPLSKVHVHQLPEKKLTTREEDILKLMANGLTSAQIANELAIEENTVETHRKNILFKFEAKNAAELIKKASKVYWLE
jgi:DNA-binding CsgD family transcriptional regulator